MCGRQVIYNKAKEAKQSKLTKQQTLSTSEELRLSWRQGKPQRKHVKKAGISSWKRSKWFYVISGNCVLRYRKKRLKVSLLKDTFEPSYRKWWTVILRCFIQNQTGNEPKKWDRTGLVTEVLDPNQYVVKIDGSGPVTRRNRHRPRRAHKKLAEDSIPQPTKEEKRKQQCAAYRARIRADPLKHAEYKDKNAARKRLARKKATPEDKPVEREKARLRQAAFIKQHQKAKTAATSDGNVQVGRPLETRADARKTEERRAKNHLAQQKRRANMSSQKKRRERERNRAYLQRKRDVPLPKTPPAQESAPSTGTTSEGKGCRDLRRQCAGGKASRDPGRRQKN
ncbi:uncharacterized protein LOC101857596 [Aplysia californica]|uniref:Uncharacterized protein LOC101857596 n=1 Tax=Aplysia californica TaxID=6500 RepID=A0ABM1W0B3_APLCA|nr:uncharacterized protein LOC101857596 [Aplysia californica]